MKIWPILLILALLLCSITFFALYRNPEITDAIIPEKPMQEEKSCNCPIEKLDQLVQNIDRETQQFLDTFSLNGQLSAEATIKKFGLVKGGIGGNYIVNKGTEVSKMYVGKSDFTGNPQIVELAIIRNLFCATIVTYCDQGNEEMMKNEVVDFKNYMLNRLNPPKNPKVPQVKKVKLKIIHGANFKRIFIDNEVAYEIPNESNLDYKTFKVPTGNHALKIEYHSGLSKEKNINLQSDATISHLSF